MNKNIALLSAVSALILSSNVNALEFRPYVGVQYNYTEVDAEEVKPDMNSYSVVVGTEYNKYFGTEIFYQNSDKSNDMIENTKIKSDFEAYGLDAYTYLPLGCDRVWSVFATAGIANYDSDSSSVNGKESDNGLGYRLGAGIQYSVTNNIAVRALARKIWADKLENVDDMKEFSLGVKYIF